jgi:formate hydrogenlyase subunit 3/multisubunit Na+/H+ antiporter MnhD subunit
MSHLGWVTVPRERRIGGRTFVGFLYMARFLQTIFLDTPKSARLETSEAPPALLVSQYLLILGILVMSLFPKLLIVPISERIDPYFASTLVWESMSLEMIYGYWNPVPTMLATVAACAPVARRLVATAARALEE